MTLFHRDYASQYVPSYIVETPPASRSVAGLPGFGHRFDTIKGLRMHYAVGGNVDGETVLLLAVYPESWACNWCSPSYWRRLPPDG